MSDQFDSPEELEFADDLLRGAAAIAAWLFGSAKMRRKVFHLVATSRLPHFRIGSQICARKSTLLAHFDSQERGGPKKK
jgi:hypothetical protein